MKLLSLLSLALLLPFASHASSASPTNTADVAFKQASLRDVTSFLTERFGLKLLLPDQYAEIPVTLTMKNVSAPDALAAISARIACEGSSIGWKESPLTDGQKAFVLSEVPPIATKSLSECAKAMKGAPRVTISFRQAKISDVSGYLQELTGNALTLIYGEGVGETPVDLKLSDVTPIDALMAVNELMKASGITMAWRGVQLPSGRMIFAMMDTAPAPAPQAGIEGPTRVYFVGDLGREPDQTREAVLQLLNTAGVRADVNLHDETKMLVVKGDDEAHALVKNVVEELRRGAGKAPAESETKK
jgi:hypothetical protein